MGSTLKVSGGEEGRRVSLSSSLEVKRSLHAACLEDPTTCSGGIVSNKPHPGDMITAKAINKKKLEITEEWLLAACY